jgi:hypothetical protein
MRLFGGNVEILEVKRSVIQNMEDILSSPAPFCHF